MEFCAFNAALLICGITLVFDYDEIAKPSPVEEEAAIVELSPEDQEAAQRAVKEARSFISNTAKAYREHFQIAKPWTDAGKERVYQYFRDHPDRDAEPFLLVMAEAWIIFQGKTGADRDELRRNYYYCQQLLNVNDAFKVHPTHNQLMVLGAARELSIDVVNSATGECIDRLVELGFVDESKVAANAN